MPIKSTNGATSRRKAKKNDVSVYLTDEEYARVKNAAESAGLSVSSWIRVVCLKEERKEGGDK